MRVRTEEMERQEARARGMNSLQELARHRLAIKKELRQQSVPYNMTASTEELENKLLEARKQ